MDITNYLIFPTPRQIPTFDVVRKHIIIIIIIVLIIIIALQHHRRILGINHRHIHTPLP